MGTSSSPRPSLALPARSRRAGGDQARAGRAGRDLSPRSREPARVALRAEGAAARPSSGSSTPTSTARSPISTTSCASRAPSWTAEVSRRPSYRRTQCQGQRRAARDLLFAAVNVARRLNVDLSSSCGARPSGSSRSSAPRRSPPATTVTRRRAPARRSGSVLRPRQGVRMSRIEHVVGRQVFDSRGNPTVEVDARLSGGASGRAAAVGRG